MATPSKTNIYDKPERQPSGISARVSPMANGQLNIGLFGHTPGLPDVLLTIAIEDSVALAQAWIEAAMEAKPWIDGNPCPPDAYDRRAANAENAAAGENVIVVDFARRERV